MSEDLSSTMKDSRDSKLGKWDRTASVGPESAKTGETDFNAFSLSPVEEVYLEFIPSSVVAMLNDKSNLNNRLAAIGSIERTLKQTSSVLSDKDLKYVVDLISISVNDSQSKLSQKALQVMEYVVNLVGKRLTPYVAGLTPKVLTKVSSNKGNLKKAGMSLFKALMSATGPMLVLNEIMNSGLRYKTSRVREESINVIISAILHFENGEIQVIPIARELLPSMIDSKAKVRQASFEAVALISSRYVDQLDEVVTIIATLHKASERTNKENGLSLMDAYHSRLARNAIPKLDENGLVQYSVPILKASQELYSGPDVDWIHAGSTSTGGVTATTVSGRGPTVLNYSQVNSQPPPPQSSNILESDPPSTFRPYRSAGKRPWETENKQEVSGTYVSGAPPQFITSPPVPAGPITGTSKRLPGNSYMELHLSKLARSTPTAKVPGGMGAGGQKPQPQFFNRKNLGSLVSSNLDSFVSGEGTLPYTGRYNSLPEQNTGEPSVVISVPSDEQVPRNPAQHAGDVFSAGGSGNSMSLTWPRTNFAGPTGLGSVPPLTLKGASQINADSMGVAGVQSTVKTSFSRPPSKPRVRNPLTLLKSHGQGHGISPPLSSTGCPIPNIGTNHRSTDSPTQLEKDFLAMGGSDTTHLAPSGWGEGSVEEDFFALIPEDTAHLNSSLSTSLASICREQLDAQGSEDKLKHIRKEVASRKALILSASTTTSNSPESPRHAVVGSDAGSTPDQIKSFTYPNPNRILKQSNSSLQTQHVDPKTAPGPVIRKWSTTLEADRVYSVGRDEKTYSQAFTKKITLNSSSKSPHRTAQSQAKRERERGTAFQGQSSSEAESETMVTAFTISSLEGHGLERGEGSSNSEDKGPPPHAQQRKKQKRPEPHGKNQTALNTSMFSSQEGSGRPTIERGGTNTILMEISGVGSRSGTSEGLSQNTKESIIRKKQRHQSKDDHELLDKKPQPSTYSRMASDEGSTNNTPPGTIASAPVEMTQKRNKHKKSMEGGHHHHHRTSKSHFDSLDTPGTGKSKAQSRGGGGGGGGALTITDMDTSLSTGGSSPGEQDAVFVETQVHSNPEQAIRTAHQSMANEDWSSKCEGMTMLMCAAHHYPDLLLPQLHNTLLAVQKEAKNLRSSVARKAVECLGYLFCTMKRAMEQDLDAIVHTLLHRGVESSAFLREVVDKAMTDMVANVSPPKALSALIAGGLNHRNAQVRKMTSKFVCVVVEGYEPSRFLHSNKDLLDRALPAIVQFCKDSSQEPRYYARKCLNALWPEPDFSQVASRVLKNNLYAQCKEVVDVLRMKGLGDPPSESQSLKGTNSGVSSTNSSRHPTGSVRTSTHSTLHRDAQLELTPHSEPGTSRYPSSSSSCSSEPTKKPRRHQEKPQHNTEAPPPEGLADRLQAKNWNERDEAITEMEKYIIECQPRALSPQLLRAFEIFCLRLTDRNSKVNVHALQAFTNMIPVMHDALVPMISNVVGALVPNLASRHLTIHATGKNVLDQLLAYIDANHLLPVVASTSQYGNSRIQPIMTRILADLTPKVYEQKPQLVNRLVLPVIWHHMTSKTPITGEFKVTLQNLCEVLMKCMGPGFVQNATHLSEEDHKKLEKLTEHWDSR